MKLLYLTESVPTRDPVLGDGSSMISYELIQRLPEDVAITLLTFTSSAEVSAEVAQRCEEIVVLDTRSHGSALARSALSRHDVGVNRRLTSTAVAEVRRLSALADVTLVHGPHVLPLASYVEGPLVLQTVDPWSIRSAMDRELASGWHKAIRQIKSRQSLAVERQLPEHARLLTVSARDAELWSAALGRNVRNIPNGVAPSVRGGRPPGPPVVCFVGSLNYGPNEDSARVLVEQIAPQVWQFLPDTRFVIAGRQPTPAVMALAGERVSVLANVPSVVDVFDSADVAVFPDTHGVGIRNSVSEALSAGVPVVATPAAAREQSAHQLLSVRDSVPDLVERIVEVLVLASQGIPTVAEPVRPERTWTAAVADYVHELRAAVSASTGGQIGDRHAP